MEKLSARRVTAILAVAGAVVAGVGNGLAPRINGDSVVVYHKIANSDRFAAAGLIVLFALLLVTAAFVGMSRTDARQERSELASYARLAAAVGGAIAIAQTGVELFGYRQQAQAFASTTGHNSVSAFWATNALDHLSAAMFATWTIVLLGIAPILLGAMQLRVRARGLGLAAVVGGAVCVVVGVASLLTADQSTYDVPFAIGSAIVTIWLLVTGVRMWRASGEIDLTDRLAVPAQKPATATTVR